MKSESCGIGFSCLRNSCEKLHNNALEREGLYIMIGNFSRGEKGYDIKKRKKMIDRKEHLTNYTNIASLLL